MKISHVGPALSPRQVLGWRWYVRGLGQGFAFAGLVALTAYSAILAKEARHAPALVSIQALPWDEQPGTKAADNSTYELIPASWSSTSPTSASIPTVTPVVPSAPAPSAVGGKSDLPAPTAPAAAAATASTRSSESSTPASVRKPAYPADTRWFNGRPVRPARTITMTVTAYSPDWRSCGDSADGITATLHSVTTNGHALVAADPRVLPYGSMVTIAGYDSGRIVPVLDCGGAIKGRRLDVLFPTHAQARLWGVRKIPVVVWEYADGKPKDSPRKLR